MFAKFYFANIYVNKAFEENEEAVKYHTDENGNPNIATFNVSGSVYDSKAENKKRYIKFRVKAFGSLAQRIQKMKLGAGANVNISGHIDNENWEDKDGNKHSVVVFIADDIEYNGSGKKDESKKENTASASKTEVPSGEPENAEDAFDDLPF